MFGLGNDETCKRLTSVDIYPTAPPRVPPLQPVLVSLWPFCADYREIRSGDRKARNPVETIAAAHPTRTYGVRPVRPFQL